MLKVKNIENDTKIRKTFITEGKLLAIDNNEPKYLDRDEVWYVLEIFRV